MYYSGFVGANLRQVLTDLKAIVHSPIKPYIGGEDDRAPTSAMSNDISDNDLPSLINRIMGRCKSFVKCAMIRWLEFWAEQFI